jgi:hypothetical protein
VIFHCEFSQRRGPKMACQFRDFDRTKHKGSYPSLWYPQVFVLEGGYSAFAEKYHEDERLCKGDYVKMMDEAHKANGDLAMCTKQYQDATAQFDRFLRSERDKPVGAQSMSPKKDPEPPSPITKVMCCYTRPLMRESDGEVHSQPPQSFGRLF